MSLHHWPSLTTRRQDARNLHHIRDFHALRYLVGHDRVVVQGRLSNFPRTIFSGGQFMGGGMYMLRLDTIN